MVRSDAAPAFGRALGRLHDATAAHGPLALTVKEGDGAGLTSTKVDRPRWFTYWRERPLREVLGWWGWEVESLQHVPGSDEAWLYVLARRSGSRSEGRVTRA